MLFYVTDKCDKCLHKPQSYMTDTVTNHCSPYNSYRQKATWHSHL